MTSPKPSPVELIASARSRLALIAATRALIYGLAPAITAFAIAPALAPINDWAGLRLGYELAPAALIDLRIGLVAAGLIALALGAASAALAWRRAHDFISAAERVDSIVNARQEILTLATLTDPSRPEPILPGPPARTGPRCSRSCGVALALTSRISRPARAFRFELGRPLMRGSALSLAIVAVLAVAMMALARPPSPEAAQARRLRDMARAIESASPTESGRALAKALRDTATALENPKLPPEQKLKVLAEVSNDIQRIKPPNSPQTGKPHDKSAKGNSGGKGNSDNGGEGAGSGASKGTGGNNAEAKGSGTGKKGDQHMAALEKELSQAKERIENESAPGDKSMAEGRGGRE